MENENYIRHHEALINAMNKIAGSPVADYVRELYLYGSFCRGNYKWDSDIDLLLSLDAECKEKHHKDIVLLKGELTMDDVDAVEVDLKVVFDDEWKSNKMLYYQTVQREGKKLW